MVVLSKPVTYQWFKPLPFTCYETYHTWDPSCTSNAKFVLTTALKNCFLLYSVFYLATTLLKCLHKKNRNRKTIIKYFQDVIRSTLFLTAQGCGFVNLICVFGRLFGKFYSEFGFIIGVVSATVSLFLERKNRRSVLAIYLLNLALETAYRMALSRNMITPIKNFQVFLFAISNSIILSLYRRENGLPKSLHSSVKYILDENKPIPFLQIIQEKILPQNITSSLSNNHNVRSIFGIINVRHDLCTHKSNCIWFAVKGGLRNFALGYAIQIVLNLRKILQWLFLFKSLKNRRLFNDFDLAKFMGSYLFIFRLCECLLRIIRNKNEPQINGFVAGLFSGFSSIFYKSSTISLYLFIKASQMLCNKGIEAGYLPNFHHYDNLVYSMSFALLCHAFIFEPHNIRPGYWRFLSNISMGYSDKMFRRLYDPAGTNASKMFPDFVPDLDVRFVRSPVVLELLREKKIR